MSWTWAKRIFIVSGIVLIVILLVNRSETSSIPGTPAQAQSVEEKPSLNINNTSKDVAENGNMTNALKYLSWAHNAGSYELSKFLDTLSLTQISKKPFDAMGKAYKIRGKVSKIEQVAPGTIWTHVMIMAKNKNSNFGKSNVQFIYDGDVSSVDVNDYVEIMGLFLGTFTGQNAFGADLEGYVFIGNSLTMVSKHMVY